MPRLQATLLLRFLFDKMQDMKYVLLMKPVDGDGIGRLLKDSTSSAKSATPSELRQGGYTMIRRRKSPHVMGSPSLLLEMENLALTQLKGCSCCMRI